MPKSTYDQLRKDEAKQWDQQELVFELDEVQRVIDVYKNIAKDKLSVSNDGTVAENMALIEKQVVSELIDVIQQIDVSTLSSEVRSRFGHSYQVLRALDTETFEHVVTGVAESIPSLAEELDKPEPKLEIRADNILIEKHAVGTVNNVLMHSLRNSMDHGIESADEREAKGKSAAGCIVIACEPQEEQQLLLRIFDDGRGLALSKLRKKAVDAGLIKADADIAPQEVADLIFHSGFSTAEQVSEVSGRGVGMDAIKRFMEEQGGKISIKLLGAEQPENQDFCPFELHITLPETMYLIVEAPAKVA